MQGRGPRVRQLLLDRLVRSDTVFCDMFALYYILENYLVRYRETGSREAQAGQERVYVYRHHSGVAKVEDSHLTNGLTV